MIDKEKKDQNKQDSQKATMNVSSCGLCRAMGNPPPCKGHGGSGGSSSSSVSSGGETKSSEGLNASQTTSTFGQVVEASTQVSVKAALVPTQLSSDKIVNYEAGLLTVGSDRLRGDLTFQVKPGLTKNEIEASREFLKAVKTAFDEFKSRLSEQGASVKGLTAVIKDNELAIHIPNPKYYDTFIKNLESKNLLSKPNIEQQEEKQKHEHGKYTNERPLENKKSFYQNPFSTRLEKK